MATTEEPQLPPECIYEFKFDNPWQYSPARVRLYHKGVLITDSTAPPFLTYRYVLAPLTGPMQCDRIEITLGDAPPPKEKIMTETHAEADRRRDSNLRCRILRQHIDLLRSVLAITPTADTDLVLLADTGPISPEKVAFLLAVSTYRDHLMAVQRDA